MFYVERCPTAPVATPPQGYTIPLDKRLAADGRGLQEVQINDQFAKLTEALYVAESKAREAVDMRQKVGARSRTRLECSAAHRRWSAEGRAACRHAHALPAELPPCSH